MSPLLPMSIALSLAGESGDAPGFARHDAGCAGVRRMCLMVACSEGSVPGAAAKAGAAAINAVAAAPIIAVLRISDTAATRDLSGNPFFIRTSPETLLDQRRETLFCRRRA